MTANDAYRTLLGREPYPHQVAAFEAVSEGCGRVLLRAPCGAGKTEAAAVPFLSQFLQNRFLLAPRLIYVLPTQALCNQIAHRLRKMAQKGGLRLVVSVQHGATPDDAMLFSDIAVTTLDHFVYAYARASRQVRGHIDLPAGSIAHSFVVFDEAHLYQSPFTFSVLRAMLEILAAAQIPTLLMTATLPRSLQACFAQTIDWQELLWHGPPLDRRLEIEACLQDRLVTDSGELHPAALHALQSCRRGLVVCNRVATSQMVYRYLHDRERSVRLIHSRYTRADRAEHEQASIKTLQTEGIVVSTQVCEAGLDVSAEILITELAPADSLIQRSGRCARRAGEKGRVLIFGADEKPYEAEHLDITATYLDEHPKLDLTDWMETCDLADTMTYEADDVAARDSLFDLFEATLYADARPGHLAVREGKYVQALLGDPAELDLSDDALRHDRLLTLPHGFAYGLHEHQALYTDKSDKLIRLQYSADGEDPVKRWVAEADTQTPLPFRTYFLKSEFYDSELGVIAHDAAGGTN